MVETNRNVDPPSSLGPAPFRYQFQCPPLPSSAPPSPTSPERPASRRGPSRRSSTGSPRLPTPRATSSSASSAGSATAPRRPPASSPTAPAAGEVAGGRPRTVGVVIKEGDNPYYADVVAGVRGGARRPGRAHDDGDLGRRLQDRGRPDRRLPGLPRGGGHRRARPRPRRRPSRTCSACGARGTPSSCSATSTASAPPSITVDNVAASEAAVRHLIDRGHERIVHVSGPVYSQHSRDRRRGGRAGVQPVRPPVPRRRRRRGRGPASRTGTGPPSPSSATPTRPRGRPGVTCFNDLVAMGVLRAVAELGLDVPGDVSVVGFDDLQSSAYLSVPLTTVHVPKREMGRRAAELLLEQIDGGRRPGPRPARVALEAELVVRASTPPPLAHRPVCRRFVCPLVSEALRASSSCSPSRRAGRRPRPGPSPGPSSWPRGRRRCRAPPSASRARRSGPRPTPTAGSRSPTSPPASPWSSPRSWGFAPDSAVVALAPGGRGHGRLRARLRRRRRPRGRGHGPRPPARPRPSTSS